MWVCVCALALVNILEDFEYMYRELARWKCAQQHFRFGQMCVRYGQTSVLFYLISHPIWQNGTQNYICGESEKKSKSKRTDKISIVGGIKASISMITVVQQLCTHHFCGCSFAQTNTLLDRPNVESYGEIESAETEKNHNTNETK